jgi:hypothetical protein
VRHPGLAECRTRRRETDHIGLMTHGCCCGLARIIPTGEGRTLWIASKGFRLHPILLSRTSPVARVVYAKRPFAGTAQVLDYVGRYTHRVAISNNRLVSHGRRQGQLPLEGLPG